MISMTKLYLHELLGYENIKIYQKDKNFKFSLDSMLLADFIKPKEKDIIVDLGTGNGPIPLFLTLKTKSKIYGVEIQEEICELFVKSIEINGFEKQIIPVNKNLKGVYKTIGANKFNIVCSNPPYFKYKEGSNVNKSRELTIARHEVLVCLEDIVKEATKLLVDGGSFYLVHRTFRLSEVLLLLKENNFGVKRLKFIYPKIESDALIFLLEAKKNRKDDVVVERPLVVHNEDGKYTDEVLKIFNFKKEE